MGSRTGIWLLELLLITLFLLFSRHLPSPVGALVNLSLPCSPGSTRYLVLECFSTMAAMMVTLLLSPNCDLLAGAVNSSGDGEDLTRGRRLPAPHRSSARPAPHSQPAARAAPPQQKHGEIRQAESTATPSIAAFIKSPVTNCLMLDKIDLLINWLLSATRHQIIHWWPYLYLTPLRAPPRQKYRDPHHHQHLTSWMVFVNYYRHSCYRQQCCQIVRRGSM